MLKMEGRFMKLVFVLVGGVLGRKYAMFGGVKYIKTS
jgi:hypothetical protein